MIPVGSTLRAERLRRKLELENISRELKISSRMLEAIEEEHFDQLPGGVFARSFVRQYANLLGLDADELAGEVQRQLDPPAPEPTERSAKPVLSAIPVPRVEEWQSVGDGRRAQFTNWLPALALVVFAMVGSSLAYSWLQREHQPATPLTASAPQTAPVSATPSTPPASAPAAVETPPAPAVQTPPAPATVPAANEVKTAEAKPVPPPVKTDVIPAPAAPAPTAPAGAAPASDSETPPASTPAPAAAPAGPAAVRVELTAAEPVWILARTDGKFAFSGTIDPNTTRTIEAGTMIFLRLGNAGGVNITLNGKPLGTLGAKGQVREVQLTSGGFQIVAAPKPSLDFL